MDALQCIAGRRSCRTYEERPVPAAMINELLRLGTQAATGSGMQPWGFAVLEGQEAIHALSDEIKSWLLPRLKEEPWLAQYEDWLHKESFNVFYNAPHWWPCTVILRHTGTSMTPAYVRQTLCWRHMRRASEPAG